MSVFKYSCPYCKISLECDETIEKQVCRCPGCDNEIIPVRNQLDGKIKIIQQPQTPNVSQGQVVVNNYAQPQYSSPVGNVPKQRVIYILLGIFLGGFGVHNFYAGYYTEGALQLCATVVALATMPVGIVFSIVIGGWVLVNVIFRNKDAQNRPMI